MAEKFSNLAKGFLAANLGSGSTTLTLQTGQGALFPEISGSDFFRIFAIRKSDGEYEVMYCTSHTVGSDTFQTISRAEESTTALDFVIGDIIELRLGASFFDNLAQKADIQDGGSVYAAASGLNTLTVTLDPAPSSVAAGHHCEFKVAADNTGAVTLNVNGTGAVAVRKLEGGAIVNLAAGDLIEDMVAAVRHNGTEWILINPALGELAYMEESDLTAPATTITGEVRWTAAASIPTGWLQCDGSEVSRTTYSALFTAIGDEFGEGDGSTTFELPNLSGRGIIGVGQGSTAEGGGLGTDRVRAESGGAETHTLVLAETPSHSHSGVPTIGTGFGSHKHSASSPGDNWGHSENGGSTGSRGSDEAHNNMHPFLALTPIIKT